MIQSTGTGTYFYFNITVEGAKKREVKRDQHKARRNGRDIHLDLSLSQFATRTSVKQPVLDRTALSRPGDGDRSLLVVTHHHKITKKSGGAMRLTSLWVE